MLHMDLVTTAAIVGIVAAVVSLIETAYKCVSALLRNRTKTQSEFTPKKPIARHAKIGSGQKKSLPHSLDRGSLRASQRPACRIKKSPWYLTTPSLFPLDSRIPLH